MNTPHLPLLATLALGALASTSPALDSELRAETYGLATGDLMELGPVLELVDAGTPAARLRLTGGQLGHGATIVLSRERGAGSVLVGSADLTLRGLFDWRGTFEVPMSSLPTVPEDVRVFAQGIHHGFLAAEGDLPLQLSQGLVLARFEDATPSDWIDLFAPAVPEDALLDQAQSLTDSLQRMLNSAGDSVRLAFELELTAGLGIEVVDAKAGGQLSLEVMVERTPDGQYEVSVARDVAGLVGVSAGCGAEVGATQTQGLGSTFVFRFHSAPGAARGILGLVMALNHPGLQPSQLLEGPLEGAEQHVAQLAAQLQQLRENQEQLEATLWNLLDREVQNAAAALGHARSAEARARHNFARASWWQRPSTLGVLVATRAWVGACQVRLSAARIARTQGEEAVTMAKAFLETRRTELASLMAELGRGARIAATILRLGDYTRAHYAATEMRMTLGGEAEAKLNIPFVNVKNIGASASASVSQEFTVRWEAATDLEPARVAVVQVVELGSVVCAAAVAGGEVTSNQNVEVEQVFTLGGDTPVAFEENLTFARDVQAVGAIGALVAYETGYGRSSSLSITPDTDTTGYDLIDYLDGTALAGSIGGTEVALEVQDRRQRNIDFGFSIDITGWGGGIEINAEWADQGPARARWTTVAEAIQNVREGVDTVYDAASGTIAQLP